MIEIKLSQGAKPGHGGMLPAAKITAEIAETRGIFRMGVDCVSPARHSAFTTPPELLEFRRQAARAIRRQADGIQACDRPSLGMVRHRQGDAEHRHPPGFHCCRRRRRRHRRCAAGIHRPRRRAVARGPAAGAQHAGRIEPAQQDPHRRQRQGDHRVRYRAHHGARCGLVQCRARIHVCARLYPVATCHTDRCPTGVATQDPQRWQNLNVPDKAERVKMFHDNTLRALKAMIAAAGLNHPDRDRPRTHHPPRFGDRSAFARFVVSLRQTWRTDRRHSGSRGVPAILGRFPRGQLRTAQGDCRIALEQAGLATIYVACVERMHRR